MIRKTHEQRPSIRDDEFELTVTDRLERDRADSFSQTKVLPIVISVVPSMGRQEDWSLHDQPADPSSYSRGKEDHTATLSTSEPADETDSTIYQPVAQLSRQCSPSNTNDLHLFETAEQLGFFGHHLEDIGYARDIAQPAVQTLGRQDRLQSGEDVLPVDGRLVLREQP